MQWDIALMKALFFRSGLFCALAFLNSACGSVNHTVKKSGLHQDVPIGEINGRSLSINIAFPDKESIERRPVVLVVHGGGFVSGNKNDKNPQIQKLAHLGFVAASAMYRLGTDYDYQTAIADIQLAIRYLKSNKDRYHLDPERMLVSGTSAGGYLATMVGVTGNSDRFPDYGLYTDVDSSVRAVATFSAPIGDFTLRKYENSAIVSRLVNSDVAEPGVLEAISPATYLDSHDAAFFIVHGNKDPVVPISMSRDFSRALKAIDHNYDFNEIEGATHSLSRSVPQQSKKVFRKYLEFIEEQLR